MDFQRLILTNRTEIEDRLVIFNTFEWRSRQKGNKMLCKRRSYSNQKLEYSGALYLGHDCTTPVMRFTAKILLRHWNVCVSLYLGQFPDLVSPPNPCFTSVHVLEKGLQIRRKLPLCNFLNRKFKEYPIVDSF